MHFNEFRACWKMKMFFFSSHKNNTKWEKKIVPNINRDSVGERAVQEGCFCNSFDFNDPM